MQGFNHDYELEKYYHPENFEMFCEECEYPVDDCQCNCTFVVDENIINSED